MYSTRFWKDSLFETIVEYKVLEIDLCETTVFHVVFWKDTSAQTLCFARFWKDTSAELQKHWKSQPFARQPCSKHCFYKVLEGYIFETCVNYKVWESYLC